MEFNLSIIFCNLSYWNRLSLRNNTFSILRLENSKDFFLILSFSFKILSLYRIVILYIYIYQVVESVFLIAIGKYKKVWYYRYLYQVYYFIFDIPKFLSTKWYKNNFCFQKYNHQFLASSNLHCLLKAEKVTAYTYFSYTLFKEKNTLYVNKCLQNYRIKNIFKIHDMQAKPSKSKPCAWIYTILILNRYRITPIQKEFKLCEGQSSRMVVFRCKVEKVEWRLSVPMRRSPTLHVEAYHFHYSHSSP